MPILEAPAVGRVIDARRSPVPARTYCPYGVLLYESSPDLVLIVAVMHCSREPGYLEATRQADASRIALVAPHLMASRSLRGLTAGPTAADRSRASAKRVSAAISARDTRRQRLATALPAR